MTETPYQQLRRIALGRAHADDDRHAAIRSLADLRTRDAAVALLELGSRPEEPDPILRAAGTALASLLLHGLVSEWDIRDLTRPAAEAFHQ